MDEFVISIWQNVSVTYPLLIQFLLCPLVFISLVFITAPYGRHYRSGWGPSLPNRTAWFLMELPALLTITILTLSGPGGDQAVAWVPLIFWISHYGYRTFIFPALMRPSQRTFPAQLVIFAVAFNLLNGFNNAAALNNNAAEELPLLTSHFVLGTLLFVAGFALHVWADTVIRRLRKPGDSTYKIPHGGLFKHITNPNYLGEIIMWTGWAVLTWSLAGMAFALFTFCNLVPRALSNHRWYLEYFPDYPASRKVLIPGLF